MSTTTRGNAPLTGTMEAQTNTGPGARQRSPNPSRHDRRGVALDVHQLTGPGTPEPIPPADSIISETNYAKQVRLAGQYRINANGIRVRSWLPCKSTRERMAQAITERDGKFCQRCGTDAGTLHLDHVIPYIKGGLFIESNLQWLCDSCNSAKGTR